MTNPGDLMIVEDRQITDLRNGTGDSRAFDGDLTIPLERFDGGRDSAAMY